jgi:hypothetical protein
MGQNAVSPRDASSPFLSDTYASVQFFDHAAGWMPWFGVSFRPALTDGRQDKQSQILSPIMHETGVLP